MVVEKCRIIYGTSPEWADPSLQDGGAVDLIAATMGPNSGITR